MKVAVMQPYFLPYIGYWQLIRYVDIFIIFDDVNYIKKGYVDRNVVLGRNGLCSLKIKVIRASQNRLINELQIDADQSHLWEKIKNCYPRRSLESEAGILLKSIIDNKELNLARYLEQSIRAITKYLEIDTQIMRSSDIPSDSSGKNKIIPLVNHVRGKTYVNLPGGRNLYTEDMFVENQIALEFFDPVISAYPQTRSDFTPNLSIADVLLNLPRDKVILEYLGRD